MIIKRSGLSVFLGELLPGYPGVPRNTRPPAGRAPVLDPPRVHAELRALEVRCGRKRVARLMRGAGLVGAHRRRPPRTTLRDRDLAPAPDLVRCQFLRSEPDRLWVADIAYVRTGSGWLYVAVVLDAFSRRVVGWAMSSVLATTLVLDALNMALWNRRPAAGVVHHSDRG